MALVLAVAYVALAAAYAAADAIQQAKRELEAWFRAIGETGTT